MICVCYVCAKQSLVVYSLLKAGDLTSGVGSMKVKKKVCPAPSRRVTDTQEQAWN